MRIPRAFLGLFLFLSLEPVVAEDWPQFRGPGGLASAPGGRPLPTQLSPDGPVVWKTTLPPGHSSPVVVGDRIYLTAVRDGKHLLTMALDRATGKVLWEREAPMKAAEKIHKIGSLAQSSPAADGQRVVAMFGSAGLYCYDRDGKELWRLPMGPFKSEFGVASSLLLVDGRVILNQDHDSDSFLAALDAKTGKTLWRVDRSEFPVNYASPILWEVEGKRQVVQAGTLRVVGYDYDTGKEIWTVRGLSRIVNMTPVVGPDNLLLVAGWAAGADAEDKIVVPPWEEMRKHDTNKNGTLELEEIPAGPVKERFPQFDRDKSKSVTREEWEGMRGIFAAAINRFIAIRPGGHGDITQSHVVWEQTKNLPYIPSPVHANGLAFLVRNGGFLTSYDARSGKVLKSDRIPGPANYYASPVYGDGKVYLVSERGELTVVSAQRDWKVLHRARFAEVYATPALADGRVYLRTVEGLYCFGEK